MLVVHKISLTKHLYTVVLLMLAAFVYPSTAMALSANHQYTVTFSKSLKSAAVDVCFADKQPRQLFAYHGSIRRSISSIIFRSDNDESRLALDGNAIQLPSVKPGDCLVYRIKFNGQITHPWFTTRQSVERQVMLEINQILLWPDNFDPQQQTIDIRVSTPNKMQFSAPWKPVASTDEYLHFITSNRPIDWDGRIIIGDFTQRVQKIDQTLVDIAVLNARGSKDDTAILEWVNRNLDALTMAYDSFPVENVQLVVVPVGRDREPVPWGHVMRGGGNGVHMYIDETRPLDEFLDDWVLVHELGHLLHPVMRGRDHWFSEGLASYYQNVLRARAGLMTEYNAWDRLHKGFIRGIRGAPRNMTLAEASESMMEKGLFMRVYWSGAAISLLADAQLRRQTDGKQSLDSALLALRNCCLSDGELWSAKDVLQRLDSITGTTIFSTLYQQHIDSTQFPRMAQLYQDLGLKADGYTIRLKPSAPYLSLRKKIMHGVDEVRTN